MKGRGKKRRYSGIFLEKVKKARKIMRVVPSHVEILPRYSQNMTSLLARHGLRERI
jgi:hypothetical protein